MSVPAALPVRTPRLNPFAFPSETTLRVVLLAIFVLCASARLYAEFSEAVTPTNQAAWMCSSQVWPKISKLDLSPGAVGDRSAEIVNRDLSPLLAQCAASMRPQIAWQLGGMCLAILVATIIYCLYPTWRLKRGRLEVLGPSDLPDVQHELTRMAGQARLPGRLTFVWNPLATSLPVVFGRHRRYYVALSGGFIAQRFYKDRESFRAVMLHELAHIQNGDVHKTCFTISLLLAFVATTLAPALFFLVWYLTTFHWLEAASLLFSGVVWTGAVVLSGLAVLRGREYYADVRASVSGQASQIDRALAALPAHEDQGWRRWLRFHPDPNERRRIVEDPSRLFRLRFAEAFGIGIAAWSVIGVVGAAVAAFMPPDVWAILVILAVGKVIAPAVVFFLAIGAIGIGVWRNAFASLLKGAHPSKGTGWLAAAFVAGAVPGLVMVLVEAALLSAGEQAPPFLEQLPSILLEALTSVALLVTCLLVFRWIAAAASAWFEVVLQSRSPWPLLLITVATALILVVGALVLTPFIAMYSFHTTVARLQGWHWISVFAVALAASGPIIIALVMVWAFPLAATFRRHRASPPEVAPWVFLEDASVEIASPGIPSQAPIHPTKALMTGLVVGLVALLSWELFWFRSYLPTGIADAFGVAVDGLFAWVEARLGERGYLLIGGSICFQALAAAIVAARERRLGVVLGLFAASVTGFLIAVGDYVFVGIDYRQPMRAVFQTLIVMGLGAIVSLPTAALAAWIASAARRRAGSSHPSAGPFSVDGRDGRPVEWPLLQKGAFVILCIVVLIGMTAQIRDVVLENQEMAAYRASALRGDGDAQNKLAGLYAQGRSVGRDDAQAVLWWRRAAERGHADAQFNLALMLFEGRGVEKNETLAGRWVRKAAEQGHADAQNVVGNLYVDGRVVVKNDALALQWYRRAAEKGNAAAQNNLGVFHARGLGTARDDAMAVEWLSKSAEQGYAEAQNNLAVMYLRGRGLPRDDALALQWFRKAAEQGHPQARNHLQAICATGLQAACGR